MSSINHLSLFTPNIACWNMLEYYKWSNLLVFAPEFWVRASRPRRWSNYDWHQPRWRPQHTTPTRPRYYKFHGKIMTNLRFKHLTIASVDSFYQVEVEGAGSIFFQLSNDQTVLPKICQLSNNKQRTKACEEKPASRVSQEQSFGPELWPLQLSDSPISKLFSPERGSLWENDGTTSNPWLGYKEKMRLVG